MARSEARVLVEIWDDDDFLDLSPLAQRMFLFLISQRDLEHSGVIALRERRWVKKSRGLSMANIAASLEELGQARFVTIDEESGELLVRSFIRRDKVFKQPNVMRAAAERAGAIESRKIREELLVELDRVIATESMTENALAVVEGMRAELAKASGKGSPKGSGKGSANPSDKGSAKGSELRPGEWGMGNGEKLSSQDQKDDAPDGLFADNAKHHRNPKEGKFPSTDPKLDWTDAEIDNDPLFKAFWEAYPRKDDKGAGRKAWLSALRNKRVTAEKIAESAALYRADPKRTKQFTKHPSTWLNAEAWANYDEVEPEDEDDDDPDKNIWSN